MPLPKLPDRPGARLADDDYIDAAETGLDTQADASGPASKKTVAKKAAATKTAAKGAAAKKTSTRKTEVKKAAAKKTAAKSAAAKKTSAKKTAAKKTAVEQSDTAPTQRTGKSALPADPGVLLRQPPADMPSPQPSAPAPASEQAVPSLPAAQAEAAGAPAAGPGTSATRTLVQALQPLPVSQRKLFVLDTNVLLHDSTAIFRFQEHDIFLPMLVLEELDHQKKGMSEVARNARQVSRYLDGLAEAAPTLDDGVALHTLGHVEARGNLHFQTTVLRSDLPVDLPLNKADNEILSVVHTLHERFADRQVVLVSKDINMRLKARTLGLLAEDYLSDHVLDDSDLLYEGVMQLPDNFWTRHGKDIESWQQAGVTYYRIRGPLCADLMVNQFVYFEGDTPLYAQVKEVSGKSAVLATLRDYSHGRNNVWGITARNREQNFAFNLLMNPDCDFVSLLGQAGTGKTLLALASGLTQTLETKRYNEIIITRATVPVGDDIGYLPGTEEEKMAPWMGALEDNLEVLHLGTGSKGAPGSHLDASRAATMDVIRSRIKVKSMSFMRGRTFTNKFLIIDEAQNLTPKQMKTLITRAGPGTKIVCMGNIAQIDTPYLTEGSSGLTYVVDRFKGWPHAGHITLQRGERSRLADYASEAL